MAPNKLNPPQDIPSENSEDKTGHDLHDRPVVICGPSGVGKGTLIDMLMKRFPNDQFGFSVSHTTREPRDGEEDGVHYNFSTVDKMKGEIEEGKFIEHAEVHGNFYGTSVEAVETVQSSGKVCILDIDVQGVKNVKKSDLNPYYVFIAPPSMEALESRLRSRGTESEEDIKKRLGNAAEELAYGNEEGNFDRVLKNDDLATAFGELAEMFRGWYPHLVSCDPNSEVVEESKESATLHRPVVICGPSGVGKGTLIDMLMKRFPNQFGFSVSHTTRKPRDGEVDGIHYNFSNVEKMKTEINEGKFIEHAEVHGNFYGTSIDAVESVKNSGEICILDIDAQGVKNVKKSKLYPHYIFVAPPTMEALELRLRSRGTESEEDMKKRIDAAGEELAYGTADGNFDRVLTNDKLEIAFGELVEIVTGWYPHLKNIPDNSKSSSRFCKLSDYCVIS